MEVAKVKAELAHHPPVSVIFDGSTHQGETLAVLVRFVYEEFEIVQRLVRLHVLEKSLSANELAIDIITILCTGLQIPTSTIICAIWDSASANGTAVRPMKEVMFPSVMNIICVSHTLDNVGRHMETPLLNKFLQRWIALFAHSPASNLLWKTQISFVVGFWFSLGRSRCIWCLTVCLWFVEEHPLSHFFFTYATCSVGLFH